jgi:hypothetical protein
MSRIYSPKTFLRQTPNALLKAYFVKKGLLKDIDFDKLGKTKADRVMQAIDGLAPGDRTKTEADFRAVNEMACAAGTRAILEEATNFHKKDWAAAFEPMKNHYERAFWTFLHEPGIFHVAGYLAEMDSLGSWRRRFAGKKLKPAVEKSDLEALKQGVTAHYAKEGRGHNCHVDNYLRQNPERHCYFVYPEDYATTDMEFDDTGQFRERARKPAFEVVFVYRPEEGLLEVNASGKKEQVEALMEVFGQTILGLDHLPDKDMEPAFDLSGLKRRDIAFTTDPTDGIDAVTVRRLRLDLPGAASRCIILEASASAQKPQAVYDLMDTALNKQNVPLESVKVSQAKLRIAFKAEKGQRAKTLTFEVSLPDRCTLKDDPHDQVAKKYLRLWKLTRERDA